jgi:hypothetical protein
MDKNGTLIQNNDNKDAYTVRGDSKGFGDAGSTTGMDPGASVWLEGMSLDANATNAKGGFSGEADSDPMFDRFKPEMISMSDIDANRGSGSESPESVSSSPLVDGGAKSDPMYQELPNEQAEGPGAPKSTADKD